MNDQDQLPRAVLFDMDGTLTAPMLDFPQIKAEMGIGDQSILEALSEMNSDERAAAETILHRHEELAAMCSTLNPGCHDLLAWLRAHDIPLALITRNSPTSVATVVERHGLVIDVILTRDDAAPKPSPEALHAACRTLQVDESDAWMVGDGQYDVEAGLAADIRTVWISHGRSRAFAATPWRTVRDLEELLTMLKAWDKRPAV